MNIGERNEYVEDEYERCGNVDVSKVEREE